MKRILGSAILIVAVAAGRPVGAAPPEQPPAGMGKYFIFLKVPPPVPPGQDRKKIQEPDVARLGGRLLQRADGYLVVYLPKQAIANLRADENVDFAQRIWMGEPLQQWESEETSAASPTRQLTEDVDPEPLTWGPKTYQYDEAGNIKGIGSDTYQYDAVSRVTKAVVNGKAETYEYDAFGNLTRKQIEGLPAVAYPVDAGSNRYSTMTYDVAGNVTNDGTSRYTYDSLNMMVGTNHGNRPSPRRMIYTADDQRIGVQVDSVISRWKVRDLAGRVLREFRCDRSLAGINITDAEWIWIEDYYYANDQLVGAYTVGPWGGIVSGSVQPSRRRRHFHVDHLGTVRLITTDENKVVLGQHDYYPFGEEQTSFYQEESNFGGSGQIRPEPMRYTGHERDFNGSWNTDNSDYLDYMHARYYNPMWGRFLSVDPGKDWDPHRPQSWNMYSYVRNNPMNRTDPTGRCGEKADFVGPTVPCAKAEEAPKNEPRTVKPEPAGGPPVPVPGAPDADWKFNPNPENKRGGSYGPSKPIKGQGQPSGSWEGGATVPHWDIDDGLGNRRRYDENGNFITPEQAHGKPVKRTTTISVGDVVGAIGLAIFGTAITIMTGGGATLQPATGVVIVPRTLDPKDLNDECPYCT